LNLKTQVIDGTELPGEDFLRQHRLTIQSFHQTHAGIPAEQERVIPLQTLHARGNARRSAYMWDKRRRNPIIGPFARTLNQHPSPPVLQEAERLRIPVV